MKITSLGDFKKNYYYRTDLVDFCKSHGLPTNLMKVELEENIIAFLGKRSLPHIPKQRDNKLWIQDRLALDAEVTDNYRSNQTTRAFFESIIGKKFSFCAAMMNYKKGRPNERVTYKDLVDVWYQEQENRKSGRSTTTKYYKGNRYNKFVKHYYSDPANKGNTRKQMILAWEEFKKSGKVNSL
ncbi:MAG: DUF6434 domain-containing protein [Patescibacteria group bacterium]